MGPSSAQRIDGGVDDIGGRVEVRLADLQVNDVLALRLQRAGPDQHFKGGFGAEARHALGQPQLGNTLGGRHNDKSSIR